MCIASEKQQAKFSSPKGPNYETTSSNRVKMCGWFDAKDWLNSSSLRVCAQAHISGACSVLSSFLSANNQILTPPAELASGAIRGKDWISEIPLEFDEPFLLIRVSLLWEEVPDNLWCLGFSAYSKEWSHVYQGSAKANSVYPGRFIGRTSHHSYLPISLYSSQHSHTLMISALTSGHSCI